MTLKLRAWVPRRGWGAFDRGWGYPCKVDRSRLALAAGCQAGAMMLQGAALAQLPRPRARTGHTAATQQCSLSDLLATNPAN